MDRKTYPDNHWLKSSDPAHVLRRYLEQQSKPYSKIKNHFVKELLGDLRGKKFIDFGCGGGMFTVYAAESGADMVLAVDAEYSVLSAAKYHVQQQGIDASCTFIHSVEFPSAKSGMLFDVILMKDVIEHVQDDDQLLMRASESLAPGGRLVVSTQNSLSLNYVLEGGYKKYLKGDKNWCGWDETHLRFYTGTSLGTKLRNYGLKPVAWRSVYLIPYKVSVPFRKKILYVRSVSHLDRYLGRYFPFNRLGWNIIIAAEKSPLVPKKVHSKHLNRSALKTPVQIRPIPVNRDAIN